jgi:LuxR family transcriptional regulator, maltose regulon positive regulatory protein
MKSPLVDYHISLIEAHAALKTGKRCRSLMSSALGLARQHGFANTFAWLPAMMARIAACALEQGIEAEYVTRLVRQRGLVPENPEVESWPWPIRVYTLKTLRCREKWRCGELQRKSATQAARAS